MSEFSRHDRVKARKTHACCECDNQILKGQTYWNGAFTNDGVWVSYKICEACNLLHDWFQSLGLEWEDVPPIGVGALHWDARNDFDLCHFDEESEGYIVSDDALYLEGNYLRVTLWAQALMDVKRELRNQQTFGSSDAWVEREFNRKLQGAIERFSNSHAFPKNQKPTPDRSQAPESTYRQVLLNYTEAGSS